MIPRISRRAVPFLCLAGIALNCLIVGPAVLHSASQGTNDFRHFYLGGGLARSPHLYDLDYVLAAQQRLLGESNPHLVPNRLPFYYLALAPLARLPYRTAFLAWWSILILASVGFVFLSPWGTRVAVALACCWSLPLLFSVLIGQDIVLILLALAVAFRFWQGGNLFVAGLILSLCLIKFHLFLLLPLFILGKRQWRAAAGLLAGALLLISISFLALGPEWPRAYLAGILNPVTNSGLTLMPNLHSMSAALPDSLAIELALSAAVVGLVAWAIPGMPFDAAFAITLLGSFLISRHTYLQDCSILLPALLIWIRPAASPVTQAGALVLLVPLPYFLILTSHGAALAAALLGLLFFTVVALDPDKATRLLRLDFRRAATRSCSDSS